MIFLQNAFLKVGLSDAGALCWLENVQDGWGNVIVSPAPGLFRAVLQWQQNWEHVAFPQEQTVCAEADTQQAWFRMHTLHTEEHDFDVSVTLHVQLDGDQLHMDAAVENRSEAMITDVYFPCVGEIRSLGDGEPTLLWPQHAGRRITHVGRYLAQRDDFDRRHQISMTYPGGYSGGASMSWMMLEDRHNALYFGSHDARFHATMLRAVGDEAEEGFLTLEFDKLAMICPGKTWQGPENVLMLYTGSWQRGASVYRKWADTWFHKTLEPDWVRAMNGYFLVINKQQFGKECFPYDQLPALYKTAQAHGCDVLGLFGWYDTGHDNGYPNLEPSPTMGGVEGLAKGIAAVQAMGGHVTLYFQGNLIDISTPFYQEEGRLLEGKNRWGTPYIQRFDKFHQSEFLREYSCKVFSTACPGQPRWRALMCEKADQAVGYGADGVLYDQIGGMPAYPCFDPAHHHENPSRSYTAGRMQLLEDLRTRAHTGGIALLSEHITDLYAQYLDAIHGMESYPDAQGTEILSQTQPISSGFPALFRYCFPECIVTVRNGAPRISPRLVGYAFVHGFRFEMEARYFADRTYLEEKRTPEWTEYAFRVAALRRTYADLLLNGQYLGDQGIVHDTPQLTVVRYQNDTRQGVALLNDSTENVPVALSIPGYHVTEYATVDGTGAGMLDSLSPGAVALLLIAPDLDIKE